MLEKPAFQLSRLAFCDLFFERLKELGIGISFRAAGWN